MLDERERVSRTVRSALTCISTVGLTLTAYILSPDRFAASGGVAVRVVLALGLIGSAVFLSVRSVWRSDFPMLRAVETLTAVVSVLIVAFAMVYLLTSGSDPAAFNEPLDHTGALYFAMTTSTTVGFGDISPVSNAARIVVMIQMLANVLVIGIVARLLLGTAKRRIGSS